MKSPRKSREKSPLFDGREFSRGETYQRVLPRFLRKKDLANARNGKVATIPVKYVSKAKGQR